MLFVVKSQYTVYGILKVMSDNTSFDMPNGDLERQQSTCWVFRSLVALEGCRYIPDFSVEKGKMRVRMARTATLRKVCSGKGWLDYFNRSTYNQFETGAYP
jgi:hypothetical protein